MSDTSIRSQLDKAAEQLTILERQIERKDFSSCAIKKALTGFISNIPSSRALSGCKDSCAIFCRCSPELYASEKQKRHELFMRYFDLRNAAKKLLNDNEQLDLMVASTQRQRAELEIKSLKPRRLSSSYREVQLEFEI